MDSGVALNPITDWNKYEEELYDRLGNDNKMVRWSYQQSQNGS
jgi:malate dehydrogenase (oxaloacetate-decarboxylating)(NADP+)